MIDPHQLPEDFPESSDDLVELLDKMYPHRCIRPGESLEESIYYSGARALIDDLLEWRKDSREGTSQEAAYD